MVKFIGKHGTVADGHTTITKLDIGLKLFHLATNGCGYESGWDCEEVTYQTAPNLQRAT